MEEPKVMPKSKYNRPKGAQRFPFISLPRALERVRALYKIASVHDIPISAAVTAWGYTEKSSGGNLTLAALKSFGLIEYVGNNEARKVKLTECALKIIRDPREISPERDELIRKAALSPIIHREIIDKYKGMPPSDEAFKAYLLLERDFKDGSVNDFLKEFAATAAYAKLADSANIQEIESNEIPLESSSMSVTASTHPHNLPVVTNLQQSTDLNDIKVLLDGGKLRVAAFVDFKGLKRLKKILDANSPLLELEEEGN